MTTAAAVTRCDDPWESAAYSMERGAKVSVNQRLRFWSLPFVLVLSMLPACSEHLDVLIVNQCSRAIFVRLANTEKEPALLSDWSSSFHLPSDSSVVVDDAFADVGNSNYWARVSGEGLIPTVISVPAVDENPVPVKVPASTCG